MLNNHKLLLEIKKSTSKKTGKSRKPYHKPRLEELGDMRDLTLGASPGVGESNGPTVYRTGVTSPGYLPDPFETPGKPKELLPPDG